MRICSPSLVAVPCAGDWETTVFFGWALGTWLNSTSRPALRSSFRASLTFSPRTSGTVNSGVAAGGGRLTAVLVVVGPVEAFNRTVEPGGTAPPARGCCATTRFAGSELGTETTLARKPCAWRVATAAGAGRPTTPGTIVRGGTEVGLAEPAPFLRAASSAPTRAATMSTRITTSHGQKLRSGGGSSIGAPGPVGSVACGGRAAAGSSMTCVASPWSGARLRTGILITFPPFAAEYACARDRDDDRRSRAGGPDQTGGRRRGRRSRAAGPGNRAGRRRSGLPHLHRKEARGGTRGRDRAARPPSSGRHVRGRASRAGRRAERGRRGRRHPRPAAASRPHRRGARPARRVAAQGRRRLPPPSAGQLYLD